MNMCFRVSLNRPQSHILTPDTSCTLKKSLIQRLSIKQNQSFTCQCMQLHVHACNCMFSMQVMYVILDPTTTCTTHYVEISTHLYNVLGLVSLLFSDLVLELFQLLRDDPDRLLGVGVVEVGTTRVTLVLLPETGSQQQLQADQEGKIN